MKKRNTKALFAFALALLGLGLAVRALFGFCWSDESFYLTFAQRLWNGQKLILDEWHPVQFYSVLFYPLLSLYHAFFGTQGIYLFAREVYVLLALGISLLLYFTLCRETRPLPAFLCAGLYLAYSRGNIWGLSYYNLFLSFCLLFAVLTLRGRSLEGKGRKASFFLGGLCLGAAVLCVPYFALFVIAGLGGCLCLSRPRRDALWALAGIVLSAGVFLVFFFPKDLAGVMANLPEIFSDPEHLGGPLQYLLAAIRDVKLLYAYEALAALLAGLLLILGLRFLPKPWGGLPGLLPAAAVAALSLWRYRAGEIGFAYYQLALFCLPGLAVCWLKREILLPPALLRLLGMAMGLSMALSSNTEAITFTVGLPVYAMGALWQLSCVKMPEGKPIRFFAGALACAVLALTCAGRVTQVFRDGPLDTLTETMTSGPAAGIRTTPEHAAQYREILSMLEELEDTYSSENRIFFSSILPWGYLAADFPCGAPTAWRTTLDSPRLERYYTVHPEAIPQIVVILKPSVGDYPGTPAPNQNAPEGWLWEYLTENQYEHLEYSWGDVYVSPQAN